MQFSYYGILAVVSSALTISLVILPRANPVNGIRPALTIGANNTFILPHSSGNRTTGVSNLNLTSKLGMSAPHCEPGTEEGLNPASCVGSYQAMERALSSLGKSTLTVGRRGRGVWDIAVPAMFLDCEFMSNVDGVKRMPALMVVVSSE